METTKRVNIKLYSIPPVLPTSIVFESNCVSCDFNFTVQEDAEYKFIIDPTSDPEFSGILTYRPTYGGYKNVHIKLMS